MMESSMEPSSLSSVDDEKSQSKDEKTFDRSNSYDVNQEKEKATRATTTFEGRKQAISEAVLTKIEVPINNPYIDSMPIFKKML